MKFNNYIVISILTTQSALCFAESPADQGDQLAAQVAVTQNAIQQILIKLKNNSVADSDGFSHPDFIAKSKIFNEKINVAMSKFEQTMENVILKQANFWVVRLNAIQKSETYTSGQKKALINDQFEQAKVIFADLSKKYSDAIYTLYTSTALPRIDITGCRSGQQHHWVQWHPETFIFNDLYSRGVEYTDHYLKIKSDDLEIKSKELFIPASEIDCNDQNKNFYQFKSSYFEGFRKTIFDKEVTEGCFTSSCIDLASNQLTSYVTLIRSSLDQSIQLFDKNPENHYYHPNDLLLLSPFDLNTDEAKTYISVRPGDGKSLPFDISTSSYRQEMTASILKVILDSNIDYKEGCSTDYQELRNLVCHSDQGCLNDGEKSNIETQIQNSKLSKKSKASRMACLQNS